ncbi:DUF6301 family protein [Microbacterium sp.]|uniref:DUF6301 family protein n=1 Tax=Microbacterium sp. TaxID=51671 RepID=UPI002624FD4E|nr:DUF6301 family protein [Microbacterium sp.]
MTWKAMAPAEVCDVIDFFESLSWPFVKSQVQRQAAQRFGWTIEESRNKHYLVNTASALSEPDVSVISNREHVLSVDMRTTDIIRKVTEESRRFLDDLFAMLVREGETRWGAVRIVRDGDRQNALWDTPAGGRIRFTGSDMDILIEYRTPQGTELERRQGH